jgi:hypothetical protein
MLKGLVKLPSPAEGREFIALNSGVLTEKIIMVQWASSYGYKRASNFYGTKVDNQPIYT